MTPAVLADLLGETAPEPAEGSQVKVNLMLSRLPRLRDGSVTPEQAFGGTFHINQTLSHLDAAYTAAAAGGFEGTDTAACVRAQTTGSTTCSAAKKRSRPRNAKTSVGTGVSATKIIASNPRLISLDIVTQPS